MFYPAIADIEDRQCDQPCSSYTSCSNCTLSKCLWCESQSACADTITYLTSFPYGRCLEWATSLRRCQSKYACTLHSSLSVDCVTVWRCLWQTYPAHPSRTARSARGIPCAAGVTLRKTRVSYISMVKVKVMVIDHIPYSTVIYHRAAVASVTIDSVSWSLLVGAE